MTSSSPKLLLTGANGQLSHAIIQQNHARSFQLIPHTKQALDICQREAVRKAIELNQPDYVINCAAYTAVDLAEKEETLAMDINYRGAENLAVVCKQYGTPLLHLSTDYIFDGASSTPYKEDEPANPINIYGKSKWLGEVAIRETWEKHLILRVSGVFSPLGKSFYKTILKLAQEKPELPIAADQITCPTYAIDIAKALFDIINSRPIWGTFHFCSSPPTSWYEFAHHIIEHAKKQGILISCELHPIKTADYKTLAKRPAHSVLNCEKIKDTFGIRQPSWQNALTKMERS